MIKKSISLILTFVAFLSFAADGNDPALNPVRIEKPAGVPPATICENGKTNCVLVIPESQEDYRFPWLTCVQSITRKHPQYSGGVARFAAIELQKIIESASGVKIPIVQGRTIPAGKFPIFIGSSAAARKYGFTNTGVKPEGFKVQVAKNALAILGSPIPEVKERGSEWDCAYGIVFGVYDFAERFIGARFYYPGPDGTIIPRTAKLVIPAVTYSDSPLYAGFRPSVRWPGNMPISILTVWIWCLKPMNFICILLRQCSGKQSGILQFLSAQ